MQVVGTFKMYGRDFRVVKTTYSDGNPALIVETYNTKFKDWLPAGKLSVNIPEKVEYLEDGEFFIKNWNENQEMVRMIRKAGFMEDTHKSTTTGFCTAPIWRIK